MSVSGRRTATSAGEVLPSANVSLIEVASATTWSAVRMSPAVSTMTPVPRLCCGFPCASVPSDSMSTSDGWTAAYTSCEKAGPGVCDARALATLSWTSAGVSGGRPGKSAPYSEIAIKAARTPPTNGVPRLIRALLPARRRDPGPGAERGWSSI